MASPDSQGPENGLVFTGERFVPHRTDPLLALEHYHRYCFAAEFARLKKIVDFGCGEGYGSAFLAGSAESVLGIDINSAAIDHAKKTYAGHRNLSFEVGRCEESPEPGGFDLAIGFELLEHLDQGNQPRFMENVGRVLKPDGVFIVSSPEKIEYAATYESANEYHKHEMTLTELKQFLGNYFKYVHLCAQRVLSASTLWRLEEWRANPFHLYARKDLIKEVSNAESFSTPLYIVALCSNAPLPGEVSCKSNSFYLDFPNSDQTKNFSRWAQRMNNEAVQSRAVVAELEQRLQERTAWALEADGRVKKQIEIIDAQQRDLENRTDWAHSLESDVAREREYSKRANQELREISSELLRIRKEMAQSYLYRVLAKLGLIPRVWDKK